MVNPDRIVNNTRAELKVMWNIASFHPALVPRKGVIGIPPIDRDVVGEGSEGMRCTRGNFNLANDVVRGALQGWCLVWRCNVVVTVTPDIDLPLSVLVTLVVPNIDPNTLISSDSKAEAKATNIASGGLVLMIIPVASGE